MAWMRVRTAARRRAAASRCSPRPEGACRSSAALADCRAAASVRALGGCRMLGEHPAAMMHICGCCCCWDPPHGCGRSLRSRAASARLSAKAETAAHWKCHLLPGQSSLRSAASEASTLQGKLGNGCQGMRPSTSRTRAD